MDLTAKAMVLKTYASKNDPQPQGLRNDLRSSPAGTVHNDFPYDLPISFSELQVAPNNLYTSLLVFYRNFFTSK